MTRHGGNPASAGLPQSKNVGKHLMFADVSYFVGWLMGPKMAT